MTEFYRHLRTAPIRAEALRQAQLSMLRMKLLDVEKIRELQKGKSEIDPGAVPKDDKKLTHPYYWAGFTIIGNPW